MVDKYLIVKMIDRFYIASTVVDASLQFAEAMRILWKKFFLKIKSFKSKVPV